MLSQEWARSFGSPCYPQYDHILAFHCTLGPKTPGAGEHRPAGSLETGHELCFCGKPCSLVRGGMLSCLLCPGWMEHCLTTVFYHSSVSCSSPRIPGWPCRGSAYFRSLPTR